MIFRHKITKKWNNKKTTAQYLLFIKVKHRALRVTSLSFHLSNKTSNKYLIGLISFQYNYCI